MWMLYPIHYPFWRWVFKSKTKFFLGEFNISEEWKVTIYIRGKMEMDTEGWLIGLVVNVISLIKIRWEDDRC